MTDSRPAGQDRAVNRPRTAVEGITGRSLGMDSPRHTQAVYGQMGGFAGSGSGRCAPCAGLARAACLACGGTGRDVPPVWTLPEAPPSTVTVLWDREGNRWRRRAADLWELMPASGYVLSWPQLLARGPVSSTIDGAMAEINE